MDECYETKLSGFAAGKRLGRLARAVPRSREDRCDACGSSLPKTLFGLKDGISGRHFFVGQNCLAWLMDNGMIAQARYRQRATGAYRLEMELRRNGDADGREAMGGAPVRVDRRAQRSVASSFRRTVLVVECCGEYRALVRLSDGQRRVSARAGEPCWRWEWTRHDGGALLERVSRPRRALVACVLGAHRNALKLWRAGTDPRSE